MRAKTLDPAWPRCLCGCGQPAYKGRKWVKGHGLHSQVRRIFDETRAKLIKAGFTWPEIPDPENLPYTGVCACGCGKIISINKPHHRYAHGCGPMQEYEKALHDVLMEAKNSGFPIPALPAIPTETIQRELRVFVDVIQRVLLGFPPGSC